MKNAVFAVSVMLWGAVPVATSAQTQTDAADPSSAGPPTDSGVEELQELVVTAQRREQSLLSVPLAVSALSSEQLVTRGVRDASQLATAVPNLQVGSAFGKSQPNFSLRGISVGTDYSANQASPIGVYFDDAYIASRNVHGSQLYDVERVEVLRGPQGTLFGRNTTGGAINIISKVPQLTASNGYLGASYGRFGAASVQGAWEQTLSPDVAGIRVAFDASRSDGTFENIFPGARDPAGGETYSGRIGYRLRPTDRLDISLKAYGSSEHLEQAAIHGIGAGPGGVNPFSGYTRAGLPFFDVDSNNVGYRRGHSWGVLAKVNYEVSDTLAFSTLTSYDGNELSIRNDADGSPLEVLTVDFGSDARQFNQELKFQLDLAPLTVVGGAYYGRDRTDSRNYYQIFYLFRDLGVPPDPFLSGAGGAGIAQQFDQVGRSTAVFSQADWNFASNWTLTAGARYTWDRVELLNARSYMSDYAAQPLFYTVAGPGGVPLPSRSGRSGAPTWRLALAYNLDGGGVAFGSYSRGYRAGTFNGNGYLDPSQLSYTKPEKVDSYEIGWKSNALTNRLTYSVSAFYADYTDQQVVDVLGVASFLRNAGKSTLKGVELETTFQLSQAVSMRASGSYLSATYEALTLQGVDLSGKTLPFAPKWTAQLGFDFDLLDAAAGTLTLSPNANYVAQQFFTPFNDVAGNGNLQQSAYALVGATLGWQGQGYSLQLYGRNLLNRKYHVWGANTRGFGFDFLSPAEPATYGAAVRFDF